MGITQGCNLCKNQQEIGEIDTDNFDEVIKAKKLFELKLNHTREISILSNNSISNIISKVNSTANDINLSPEITSTKPEKGFKTELIRFNNGDIYQGYFNEKNQKDGYGEYIKTNGFTYKGLWKDDKIGDYGAFIEPNGNYFKGHFINGQPSGDGEMIIQNKIKCIGNFNNNLPNKKVKLFNYIDSSLYEGDMVNGKKEGKGILKFKDGTVYEGEFMNDKYEGKGKLKFKNGCCYEGNFSNNYINGKGKYIYLDGKEYNGDFHMGLKHGFGRLSWNDNKYFEGYWINNKQHGEGIFYLNGKILKGIFRYGKMIMKVEQ